MIESKGHKITPIDGDLAVSRNAEIGGDADIHGKARVAGSLKVEGFLDAPNIKGAVKGFFATEEELKREYPNPRPGWCAIVLADKGSGFLYLAKNREWEKQSEEAQPFDFIVDSINVFASKGELGDLENKVNVNADDIYHLKHGMDFRLEDEVVELMLYQGAGNSPIPLALLSSADELYAGVMSAEDKRNLNNSTVKVITWNNDTNQSNMNDFVVAGVYNIKGERTRDKDNLPILNTGGHSFNARLTVLDSSISGSGENDDKCITQVLSFSNRLGQGEVYIRTGKGSSLDNLTWEKWSTLQRNVNVDKVESLDELIDNGIYSGVLNPTGETFVLVVINNYAFASSYGIPKSISQFKYSVSHNGVISFSKRVKVGDGKFLGWEIINYDEITLMINDAVDKMTAYTQMAISTAIEKLVGTAPETLDTLQEIAEWVSNHQDLYGTLKALVEDNAKKINDEIERSIAADQNLLGEIDTEARRATEAENELANAIDEKIAKEKTRAEAVEQTLANDIANAPNLALRALFVAAGAEYNDSGADKTKTAPWGETVIHKAGHYYLNGLGDITESQMIEIYNAPHDAFYQYGYINSKARTVFQKGNGSILVFKGNLTAWGYSSMFESFGIGDLYTQSVDFTKSFKNCQKLKYITFSNLFCYDSVLTEIFDGCVELKYVALNRLSTNVSFKDSTNISKACILYIIKNSRPTTAITITLHTDAYARLVEDSDIIEALAARPLVTLVSA